MTPGRDPCPDPEPIEMSMPTTTYRVHALRALDAEVCAGCMPVTRALSVALPHISQLKVMTSQSS